MKKFNKQWGNTIKSFDEIRFYGYFGWMVVMSMFYTVFFS